MRLVRLLDDTLLNVHDKGEALSDHIDLHRDYFEEDILNYLSDKHPVNEVIIDVGANIGNHTVYFAQYLEYSQIIAFEPVPANFKILRENTKRFPNIQLRYQAVGAERKMVRMLANAGNMGASEINPEGDINVMQVRIDDLLLRDKVTLMKIDVEWYEPQVLLGAANIIETDKPLILVEDSLNTYADTFASMKYTPEKAWPEHKTYLYRSADA